MLRHLSLGPDSNYGRRLEQVLILRQIRNNERRSRQTAFTVFRHQRAERKLDLRQIIYIHAQNGTDRVFCDKGKSSGHRDR